MDGKKDTKMAGLPSPPFISVSGILNFRDVGGYAVDGPSSSSAHSIRTNMVYRCGEPSRVTEDGIETLQSLGITHIYDLRSKVEIERNKEAGRGGIKEWSGCERVFAPVFLDMDYSPEALAIRYKDYADGGTEGFTRAYMDIMTSAPTSYRKILLHIANEPSKPLIIHCTAGKDRTGLICALILSLCGVGDEVVAYEYSLTEIGLAEFKNTFVQHLIGTMALKGNIRGAENMTSARAANMLATLHMIRETFGGVEQYITQKCGLALEDVHRIRANLVVEAEPIHQLGQQRPIKSKDYAID